jgi:hypothetical protein
METPLIPLLILNVIGVAVVTALSLFSWISKGSVNNYLEGKQYLKGK